MIPNQNRNLLVINKAHLYNDASLALEVECLHKILLGVEKVTNVAIAHEVIDLNKGKITTAPLLVQQAFELKKRKAFVFFNCKN